MRNRTRTPGLIDTSPIGMARRLAFRFWPLALVALFVAGPEACLDTACGQDAAKEKEEIPKPEELVLTTGDGVELAVTYYPPIKPGKEVVPVVLLHQFKGSRRDYVELAVALQNAGHAVILPDLRGHGRSTSVVGSTQRIEADRLTPTQLQRMVVDDMEYVNRFLWDRNNAGDFNVNKLCLVGAEMGASVALLYAARDWDVRPYGAMQLGQFVKGLVLISPEWSFKGLTVQPAMRHPGVRSEISVLVIAGGRKQPAVRESKRLFDMFKPHHPDPPANRVAEDKDLFYAELDTALQGTDMLGQNLKLEQYIAQFINLRLVKAPKARTFDWQERRRQP